MFDPTEIVEELQIQIQSEISSLKECKDIDEKIKVSQLVKNLAKTQIAYMELVSDFMNMDDFEDFEDFDEFDEDDEDMDMLTTSTGCKCGH